MFMFSVIVWRWNIEFYSVGKPSRVIHIRNIPNDSSESEVIQLGLPFGRVTNVLVLKGKNQAFLEMADEVCAAAMVACFNTNPPQVRGRTVYVQFSNHRELKIDQSHSVIVSINHFAYFVQFQWLSQWHKPRKHAKTDRYKCIQNIEWTHNKQKLFPSTSVVCSFFPGPLPL